MTELYRTICGVIWGLMFFCGFGAAAYGAGSCVTEVLDKETTAFAMPSDLTLELQLKKEKDLISIPNSKEVLNEGGALKENFLYPLSSEKYNYDYELKESLVVRAESGQRYLLAPETTFQLTPPSGDSPAANYAAIIPAGKKLIKKEGTAPEEYELAEDMTVKVAFPKNSQVTLKLYPQTIVERRSDPRASSIGTTLTVEPKKAPLGGYIRLTVKKRDFEFNKAQFYVCLRLHGKDEAEKKEFFASDDVELLKVERGEAILRTRIPEKIDGLGGLYLAKPADLTVVASIPGDEVKRAEVTTQEFSVSSRPLAVLIWFLAFVIPWFIAALVAACMGTNTLAVEAAQTNLNTTQQKLEEATKAGDSNRIAEFMTDVEELKELLNNTKADSKKTLKAWKAKLNPVWIVSGKIGGASLSLAQILLWSILVFSSSFYVLVVSGRLLDLTNDVLMLLGIAGGASVIAKITASAKDVKGQALVGATEKEPKWLDLIKTEGRPDLYKFQMALFTTLAAVFVTREIYSTLEFPILPAGLLTLIGISNGVYLTAKASSKTAFEELAEIDSEHQKAKEDLEKLKNEATKLDVHQNKAKGVMEAAQTNLNTTQQKLEEATKAGDTNKVAELTKKIEEDKASLQKANEDQREASDEKTKADAAVAAAEQIVDKLRKDFESKKNQALQ
jgi:uncharacterized membrane protein (DUF106 family)